MKRFAVMIVSFLIVFFGYAYGEEKVVVLVNGAQITEGRVGRALAKKIRFTQFHRKGISDEKRMELREEAIEELIDAELLYQLAVEKKVTVADDIVEKEFNRIKGKYKNEEDFWTALEKAGLSKELVKRDIHWELMIKKIKDKEVTQKAAVTDEMARDYYKKNKEKFRQPEKMKLWEMFFSVPATATTEEREAKRKKAEDILKRARAGEDFGLLAWEHSEDDYRFKSGDIGFVHEGTLTPVIEQELKKRKPGEITDVIETIYGYYIFYLEAKAPQELLEFEQVKDKLKKDLRESREKTMNKELIQRLRKNAEIKRLNTT